MQAYSTGQTAQPTATPGTAQPIQPQSQGTPYGADPGHADRVAAAAQQWNSTPAGSQQFGNWQNNPSSVARERQQERAARNAEMAAAGLASDQLTQQANNTERLYVQNGFAQRQFERDGQNVTELAPSYGIPTLGTEHLPRYRRLPDGTMQRVDQADRAPVGGWGAPGQAQPIQPQTQGTPYPAAAPQSPAPQVQQPQVAAPVTRDRFGRPVQPGSIEEDMAADSAAAGWTAGWDQEASRRGVDPATGAPLASRTAEQEAYHRAAYSPPNDQLPPQNEGLLAYLRQRDAPKQPAQAQQLYRTALNAGVPGQQLAFEQDAFRNMAQRAVDREAFHGANDPYVQQFVNRMQYQGFDPRQGLTASQNIQDAMAVRQRNDAIRANPMAYLRGEL